MLSTLRQKRNVSETPPLTVKNILTHFQSVKNWRKLGEVLFPFQVEGDRLVYPVLDEIESRHTTYESQIRSMIERWTKGEGDQPPSWRRLIFSLDWAGEVTVADPIRVFAEPPKDTTLTPESIIPVMKEIRDLSSMWSLLDVPDTIQHRITRHYTSETEQSCAAGEWWVNTHPIPSWDDIALRLYVVGEYRALEKVAQNLPKADPTLTTENLMEVMKGEERRWEDLAAKLVVPNKRRGEIKLRYRNDIQRMEKVMRNYATFHPLRSWGHIASSLQRMRLHQQADFVTTKYIRGPEERYLAACERAIKENGSLEQITMHCVFMGMPRSGKSSLMRRLLGKRLSSCTSTGVAEPAVRVDIRKSTVTVSGLLWCELEDLDDEATLLMQDVSKIAPEEITVSLLTVDTPIDTQPRKPFSLSQFFRNLFIRIQRGKQHQEAGASSPNLQSPAKQQIQEQQDTKPPLEVFRDAFQKKWPKLKDMVDEHWTLYLTDTGGQPEFQELLPILVCGPSLFFLVFRLDLELSSRYKVEYINSSGRSIIPYEAGLTVQETLLQSLATIASTSIVRMEGSETVNVVPSVFFVGTHKDIVSDKQLHQIDSTLQTVVKGTEAYREGMVQFASESRLIIAVDNLSEGEEDVQQVRAAVERVGKQGDKYRVKTPVSWLMFSNILRQMKSPVLKYEQCYNVAQECGINTRAEMNDALRFLHENVGVVRYYHDVKELREYVIKELRYLFDMITDLLVATFTFERTDPSLCELFARKGIFPLGMFEKLAKSTEFLPPSKLVALLQHLNIVAVLREDGASSQYFIPCVLAHSENSQSETSDTTVSHVPPLLVTFQSGYCPKGLFGAVVVYLLQNKMKSKLQWGLEQDKIFRDKICFIVGPCNYIQLKVLPSFLSIKVCAVSGTSTRTIGLASICSEVRRCIDTAISEVSKALHCSRKVAHSLGFSCPHVDANRSPHPATIAYYQGEPFNLMCPITQKRFDLPEGYQVWFEEDSSSFDKREDSSATSDSVFRLSREKQDLPDKDVVSPSTCVIRKAIVLDSKPRLAELLMLKTTKGKSVNIIESLAPQWKQFGLCLDFDHTGRQLDLIEAEQSHRVVACCREMFKHWLEGNGVQPVTWRTLIEILDHCNEMFLVEQIENALKMN